LEDLDDDDNDDDANINSALKVQREYKSFSHRI